MKSKLTILYFTLLILFIPRINLYSQYANYDSPVYDIKVLGNIPDPPNNAPLAAVTVTTSDGYDNFNSRTDFAEPHMSVNPRNPLQFYNMYNSTSGTNYGHYTLNGFDWANHTPVWGTSVAGDPVTAYDSLGNLYTENLYGYGNKNDCFS